MVVLWGTGSGQCLVLSVLLFNFPKLLKTFECFDMILSLFMSFDSIASVMCRLINPRSCAVVSDINLPLFGNALSSLDNCFEFSCELHGFLFA